ncbi:MAG: hypothetical protein WCE80_08990 [Acidimicrobiia bacterium]
MWRSFLIAGLAGLLTVTGVAEAAPDQGVGIPVDMGPPTSSSQPSQDTHVIVERGDHLWKISARHLGDGPVTEVAPYWRQVVVLNTPRLRSGNPDLIYPGEEIELPPVERQP